METPKPALEADDDDIDGVVENDVNKLNVD